MISSFTSSTNPKIHLRKTDMHFIQFNLSHTFTFPIDDSKPWYPSMPLDKFSVFVPDPTAITPLFQQAFIPTIPLAWFPCEHIRSLHFHFGNTFSNHYCLLPQTTSYQVFIDTYSIKMRKYSSPSPYPFSYLLPLITCQDFDDYSL